MPLRLASLPLIRFTRNRLTGRLLLVGACLTLLSSLTASPVAASCGRYVVFDGGPVARHEMVTRHETAQNVAEGQKYTGTGFPASPCDGPRCGQRNDLPAHAPPAAPHRTSSQDWAVVDAADGSDAGLLAARLRLNDPSPRDGYPAVIDRPPRF